MLGDPAFCYPIAAAQVQYRDRYYGLSAASLLEDLFFDSLVYYARQNDASMVPERPPRGKKGYDYEIAGDRISHKVGKRVGNRATTISVLWDATRRIEHWSATSPILYHFFDAAGRKRELHTDSAHVPVQQVSSPSQQLPESPVVLVVHWQPDGTARNLGTFEVKDGADLAKPDRFRHMWPMLRGEQRLPANEIELLVCSGSAAKKARLASQRIVSINDHIRPGIYFLDPDLLQDVVLTRNNRGQLIPAAAVEEAMDAARRSRRFVPLPTWFSVYTQVTPPSLYLAQKQQFDGLFGN
jgi:hypothetical protein